MSSQNIWEHLETYFNLEKADFVEKSFKGYDSADKVVDFKLPEKFCKAITVKEKGTKVSFDIFLFFIGSDLVFMTLER